MAKMLNIGSSSFIGSMDLISTKPPRLVNKFLKNKICSSWEISFLDPELKRHFYKAAATAFAATLFLSASHAIDDHSVSQTSNLCGLAFLKNDGLFTNQNPENGGPPFVMGGMTAKNFNPARYAGRWYEVASLKSGFAGQGQEDCHCTQGVYTLDTKNKSIQVDTFCAHGSPDGYITGIRGRVTCVSNEDLASIETETELQEMISEKCFLKFPFLPFIPKEPYDVIDTDYDTFALVSGSRDKGFVQIYSRTPNPGAEFIQKYKDYLANIGYNASKIKDTPQDCDDVSMEQLNLMMSMPGMQEALTNKFPDLALRRPVQFNPVTSVIDTLKKLLELYIK